VPNALTVYLNLRLQPTHRHELEDALTTVLERQAPGVHVVGGGTIVSDIGEPLSCEIELASDGQAAGDAVAAVIDFLEFVGAPRGSSVVLDDGEPVGFGSTDGLGLYLNGTGLPDEVYASSTPDELIDLLTGELGADGGVHSFWEGPAETALYLYGPSASRMTERIANVLATYPLAQDSRLVPIT
jgi:hypothetical protein